MSLIAVDGRCLSAFNRSGHRQEGSVLRPGFCLRILGNWHGKGPNDEEYEIAMKELNAAYAALEEEDK